MRLPQLALAVVLSTPACAFAQSAPGTIQYNAPNNPAAVAVPIQNTQYLNPVQVPTTATPAPSGSRCVITGYTQQTTGAGAFGGAYTTGLSASCPL